MAKKATTNDPVFGKLRWDASEAAWATAVEVPYFRSFGKDLPDLGDEDEDDLAIEGDDALSALSTSAGFFDLLSGSDQFKQNMAALPAEQQASFKSFFGKMSEAAESIDDPPVDADKLIAGTFLLEIKPGEKKPPLAIQREAWNWLTGRAKPIFNEVMKLALHTYQRQRPVRLRWWKKVAGKTLSKHLPDAKTPAALAKIVVPQRFRVYSDGTIGIPFDASWDRGDGFGVLLRSGEIVDVGPQRVALEYQPAKGNAKLLDHPVFGPLKLQYGDEWVGSTRFDAFGDFFELREAKRTQKMIGDRLPWSPPWDFVEGRYDLTVHASDDEAEPTEAQADALAAIRRSEKKVVAAVCEAVLKYYRKYYLKDEKAGARDRIRTPADLRMAMTFQSVNIGLPKKRKPPAIVLTFSCAWDEEHGMSVLWRDGKVEAVDQAAQVGD